MVKPEQALKTIKKYFVGTLKGASCVLKRYEMLDKLVPEMISWREGERFNFLTALAEEGIDAGLCKYYSLEGGKTFCSIKKRKVECTCSIPQIHCVIRDCRK